MKIYSTFTILAALSMLPAQEPAEPPPAASTSSKPLKAPAPAVRRFSAGGILLVSGLPTVPDRSTTESGTNRSATYKAEGRGSRFGGGLLLQAAFADRLAVTGLVLLRRAKFESNNEITVNSAVTKQNDFSSADFWELPLTLRRYSQPHAEGGGRWFAEGGVALRRVRNIRSSLQTTDPNNKTVCCDERPTSPKHRWSTGVTVGGGYQWIDQFGLRLVPTVRYTRWLQRTFDGPSARTAGNQIEAGFAVTF